MAAKKEHTTEDEKDMDELFGAFEAFLGEEEVNRDVAVKKGPKCAECKKDIIKDKDKGCTAQDGKTYHIGCFCCDECKISIAGMPYATDKDGAKVCQKCVQKHQGK